MCGIVGIVGQQPVSERLVDALTRLEYRGYDSAGVATITEGALHCGRAEGKLVNLEARLKEPLSGTIGIAHTCWATHGAPTERNAHPHFSDGVVHNGIIENFAELKDELAAAGAAGSRRDSRADNFLAADTASCLPHGARSWAQMSTSRAISQKSVTVE